MPAKLARRQTWLFFAAAVLLLLATTGCCGPMACGPAGCGGPIAFAGGFGGRACGDGCNGCGERYIDEWINHPPSCTDPCDSCGNFNGQSCHACRPIFSGFPSIWGYRCEPLPSGCDRVACLSGCGCDSGCDSGCSSCGGGHPVDGDYSYPVGEEEIHFGGPVPLPPQSRSSQAPTIVRGVPSVKTPSQPQRTRQIFRPRDSVAAGQRSSY